MLLKLRDSMVSTWTATLALCTVSTVTPVLQSSLHSLRYVSSTCRKPSGRSIRWGPLPEPPLLWLTWRSVFKQSPY
uniref:Putative secreted protein n=1 Tax=Ixodes ricinus TaxID=34613 RepID=A0A6B0U5H2_IXORI